MTSYLTKSDTNPIYDQTGKVVEFTIKRSKWGQYSLIQNSRKGCCMGHYGLAVGYSPHTLKSLGGYLPVSVYKQLAWLTQQFQVNKYTMTKSIRARYFAQFGTSETSTTYAQFLGWINDNPMLTRPQKERSITEVFAKHGIKVNFVD